MPAASSTRKRKRPQASSDIDEDELEVGAVVLASTDEWKDWPAQVRREAEQRWLTQDLDRVRRRD